MGGEDIAAARPHLMLGVAVLHYVRGTDERCFGLETQGAGGHAEHALAVQGVDGDVRREAGLQLEVGVGSRDDYFVGHHRAAATAA